MLRDVFYYGKKPNAHPREQHATDLADARQKSTTEHFWIINDLCDYRNFDWDFDFEFLPDEDVWAEEHNNVWPSQHQKDSGTWLCNTDNTEALTIYRGDVDPVIRRKEKSDAWVFLDLVDETKFDLSWHPDPTDPPYIYKWGSKFAPVQLKTCLEYHVPGATQVKYMDQDVELLPNTDCWVEFQTVNKDQFDMTWRPDPLDPPLIYVWGNKYIPGNVAPTVEYRVIGATERKYLGDVIVEPEWDKWKEIQQIDKTKFDYSWRPDPTSPPYIYVWGNKYIPGEVQSTIEYHVPGATDYKYMEELVDVLPDMSKWEEVQPIDKTKFDFAWRPNPTEPPYIYVWGNKHVAGELMSTIEYHVPGATEKKYMEELVDVLPDMTKWVIVQELDKEAFDFSWRPDPTSPPYIYVWGNKYIPGELLSTVEYHCDGATEKKYMDNDVTVIPQWGNWRETQLVDKTKFDFTWRPDPTSPPYIYVWGNKYVDGTVAPTVEYIVEDATQIKYMSNDVEVLPELNKWNVLQRVNLKKFDLAWRPNPTEPPYIYAWSTPSKWETNGITVAIEYIVSGTTEYKYMDDVVELIEAAPEIEEVELDLTTVPENYVVLQKVKNFDFTWRPDPREPDYIYVWGNKYIPAEIEPTLEYHVPGATNRKYMGEVDVQPDWDKWKIIIPVNKSSFDFSWRPDPREPAFIYVWGNKYNEAEREPTLEYHCPGATQRKYMNDVVATTLPDMDKWKTLIPVDEFDYSWRPDPKSPPYIYVFGNKWNDATTEPSLEYHVEGATEYKYVNEPVATPQVTLSLWSISNNDDLETFDFSWRPNPHSPPQIYQWADNGPRYTVPGATEVVLMEGTIDTRKAVVNRYKIKTTLEDLINEHPEEVFWAINPDLSYEKFDFSWRPNEENFRHVNVFGNEYSKNTQTYYVNGPLYMMGHKELNYVDDQTVEIDSNLSMFFVDKNNSESQRRFDLLKQRYPQIQKTRYLNSWVDTINRCINKSETELCWILNSELDYTDFVFDYYPSPWQQKMVHVFGTQWSHWGTTFMVNKESFPEDTKYVKIIEHLNNLNFVKSKRAVASNCLYDVYLIDYGNDSKDNITSLLENKTKKNVYTIEYAGDYLSTLKNMLYELGIKKDHYIWVCSSICDYTNFDFTYICDPFSLEQLHVFPSDKQKYGDTFFINVNRLRSLVEDLDTLENIDKINFNQHQQVTRLPAPNFITESDTHVSATTTDFDWPYATFQTVDNKEIKVSNVEPISLWSKESKNILITSTGGTHIVVPKEAKEYVKNELYDYPYIAKSNKLATSQPLDIVFLSNGETGADENYEHLLNVTKGLPNRVVRVDSVNGRVQAYHAAAEASNTPWMFTVFAKLRVNSKFDFSWQPDRLQVPKHYIFYASNPVNGLVYGHQAMIAYNKKITLGNIGKGLDFTLDSKHEVVETNSGVARYNTDEFSTWRTSFREAIKLKLDNSPVSRDRLKTWSTVGVGDFAQYSIQGAKDAVAYVEQVDGDLDKLRLSYDWPWLKEYFNNKYK